MTGIIGFLSVAVMWIMGGIGYWNMTHNIRKEKRQNLRLLKVNKKEFKRNKYFAITGAAVWGGLFIILEMIGVERRDSMSEWSRSALAISVILYHGAFLILRENDWSRIIHYLKKSEWNTRKITRLGDNFRLKEFLSCYQTKW